MLYNILLPIWVRILRRIRTNIIGKVSDYYDLTYNLIQQQISNNMKKNSLRSFVGDSHHYAGTISIGIKGCSDGSSLKNFQHPSGL